MTLCASMEQYHSLEKLHIFKIKGRDKGGRLILTILAKFFPAHTVSVETVTKYLQDNIYPRLEKEGPFSVLYVHTHVQRAQNFPGISSLRCIYDHMPSSVKNNLQSIYFVHPDLHSRLLLATVGRLFFSGGWYAKVKYVSRVDYLWEHVRRNETELPEYVYDHDQDLEYCPMMDYGLESDHPRVYGAPSIDSPVATYSMRCIS